VNSTLPIAAAEGGMIKRKSVELRDPVVQAKLRESRVGHLATAGPEGDPLVIPVCFASNGRAIFTPIDRKPKHTPPERLARVRHILRNPRVALVIDHYEDDWSRLWFILIRGHASLLSQPQSREHRVARALLEEKYPQYRAGMLPRRAPIVQIIPERMTLWGKMK
jgi:PPOX class probable F420-dependent enzyme